jgi:glycosyltransferase involved in cell wall biosynthesis
MEQLDPMPSPVRAATENTFENNPDRLSVGVLLSSGEKFGPYYGGALARWTFEVYSRLQDEMDIRVFGFPTPEIDRYPLAHQTSSAWRVSRLLERIPLARRYHETFWLRALYGRLRDLNVIHVHNRPQWISALRRMGYRGQLILHLHNNHLGHWTTEMLEALAPQVDAVAVCSRFLRETFARKSAALAAKTHVIFNGVNTEMFFPNEDLREPKTIFFVGRFHPEKGVLQLVRAFSRVLQRHPDAKLVIGGSTGFGTHAENSYVREVKALAESLVEAGGAQILFSGYIHHDRELPAWFQRASVFCSPSLFLEPFGLVNAEAMACATPVVGSNRGGIPEVLGTTGVVVDPENVEELAAALIAMLDQPERTAALGKAACERCRRMFDWRIIARQWSDLLNTCANGKRRATVA